MAFDRLDGRAFEPADLQLAEAIGQQGAVALENARLYERARQEASTSQALLRITRAMNASLHLDEILQLIVDSLAELIGTPAVAVYLAAANGTDFELAATRALALRAPEREQRTQASDAQAGDTQASDTQASDTQAGDTQAGDAQASRDGSGRNESGRVPVTRAPVSELARLVAGGRGPGVIADTRDRPDLTFPTLRDGSVPRSVAIAPIRLGERVLGVVEAYSTEPGHFVDEDSRLLGAFSAQAATAIEGARLYGQARELALLQERDRIAKDLHDGIIQTIYAV